MGAVFKQSYTKPLPADAETFTREGQRFATWRDAKGKKRKARITVGKDGSERLIVESPFYFAKYRDGSGIVRKVPTGCKDETAARSVLATLERRGELVKAKVMTQGEDAISRHQESPLDDHIETYRQHLRAKGKTAKYIRETGRAIERIAADCSFLELADLCREPFERWLVSKTTAGMSASTRNSYREALVVFCNWCVDPNVRRLLSNPFAEMEKANEKADPRRRRRGLKEDELTRLLDVAQRRPLLDALTIRTGKRKGEAVANVRPEIRDALQLLGRERALIYKTLLLTGLRKNELASLTVSKLNLDGPIPFADLAAADEKNREGSEIVLRVDLAADLREWLTDKLGRLQSEAKGLGGPIPSRLPPDTPVFKIPSTLLKSLNRDLRMAGIAKRDDRGRTFDIHALRTTFATLLTTGGVAPRTAQAAMRHSDIRLTMQTYTDERHLDIRGALDSLPTLVLNTVQPHPAEVARELGTNEERESALTPALTPTLDNSVTLRSFVDKGTGTSIGEEAETRIAAMSYVDNGKGPLTSNVIGPNEWALRVLNPRPPGCKPGINPSQDDTQSADMATDSGAYTADYTNIPKTTNATSIDALAAVLLGLSADDRVRIAAALMPPATGTVS